MLFKLDELVRPYVHKILVVIEPLLIDEDYYARVEGRWGAPAGGAAACGSAGVPASVSGQASRLGCRAGRAGRQPGCRARAGPAATLARASLPPANPATPSCPLLRREIIANLSKAAGLATMIAAMRPDIDNVDEYVRNTTARAFSGTCALRPCSADDLHGN